MPLIIQVPNLDHHVPGLLNDPEPNMPKGPNVSTPEPEEPQPDETSQEQEQDDNESLDDTSD